MRTHLFILWTYYVLICKKPTGTYMNLLDLVLLEETDHRCNTSTTKSNYQMTGQHTHLV